MSAFHDPLLLELVALHSAMGLPQKMQLIKLQLAARLECCETRIAKFREYLKASAGAVLRTSPVIYYALHGLAAAGF